jgi:RimJ/RimL family protein N-acetyltransferase
VTRARVAWRQGGRTLEAREPTAAEIAAHAPALAAAYSDPRNAPLLGHTEPLDADDVIDHYRELADEGARQFHLLVDGELVGDADLRGVEGGAAEFAFLIAAPAAQGQGLGTRFALMIHAFAFAAPPLGAGLHTIYASVLPANAASLRVFQKLGYAEDDSPAARAYADEPGDVVLAIGRAAFLAALGAAVADVTLAARADEPVGASPA